MKTKQKHVCKGRLVDLFLLYSTFSYSDPPPKLRLKILLL